MNDSTTPGCLCDYGHPINPNGPCAGCKWKEVCEKSTKMNKALKAEFLGKVDSWLDILRGEEKK